MEAKEYYSLEEVASMVGRNRGTIYNRVKLLNIKVNKFPQDRRTYIASADVEKIKQVIEKPWMAKELGAELEDHSAA